MDIVFPDRKSIRLKGYDYTQSNWYYVTICTHERVNIFGRVEKDKVFLNEWGVIVKEEWEKSSVMRKEIMLDEYIILPNHMHGIIIINKDENIWKDDMKWGDKVSGCLGSVVRGFKAAVTTRINTIRNSPGKPVWQKNYYEHIIRDEKDLQEKRHYIYHNAAKWEDDPYGK